MAKKEKIEKDESDDEKMAKDEESDGDGQQEQDPENPEEADIRDMRHKLEKLVFCYKDFFLCPQQRWSTKKPSMLMQCSLMSSRLFADGKERK